MLALVISLVISLPVLPQRALNPILAIEPDQGEEVGWPGFVDAVAAGWRQIPVGERGNAVILTENYGEAGAIDQYGYLDGLPAAYSGHMSYSAWGPPADAMTGPVLVVGKFTPAPVHRLPRDFPLLQRIRRARRRMGRADPALREQDRPLVVAVARTERFYD